MVGGIISAEMMSTLFTRGSKSNCEQDSHEISAVNKERTWIVERRCAMTSVVRPTMTRSRASCTRPFKKKIHFKMPKIGVKSNCE